MQKQIAMVLVRAVVAVIAIAQIDGSVVAGQVVDGAETVAKNSVGSRQIIDRAIKNKDLKSRSVKVKNLSNWWETGSLMANATVNPEIRNWNGKRLKGPYYLKSFCVLTRSEFVGDDHAASIQIVMVGPDGTSQIHDVAMAGYVDFHPTLYFDSVENGVLKLKTYATIGLHKFNCRFETFKFEL